uniref:Uncharacterized protein n=1 Tax=Cacopsylla melanoneura TaxID=428564 RepID=A0A8D8XVQ8_9HEMI
MKRYHLPGLFDDAGPPPRRGFGPPHRGGFGAPPARYGQPFNYGRPHDYDDYGPPSFPRRGELPMSPFLQRMMRDDYDDPMGPKEKILRDLGASVLTSLKQGRKLSDNPFVREKIETLIEVEAGPPPLPARGPYSRYDSFYETNFLPPRLPMPPVPPASFGKPLPHSELYSQQFLRIGHDRDPNRVYASERELRQYLNMEKKIADMNRGLITKLKNTFSFEIRHCKDRKRKEWLLSNITKINKKSKPKNASTTPIDNELKPKRKESARKKEKKRLRDKRPPKSFEDRRIINYLKSLLFDMAGEEDKEHVVLVLRSIHFNTNMIQCLMSECKTFLDQKFGTGNDSVVINKKLSYLTARHQRHIEDSRLHLLAKNLKDAANDIEDSNYELYNALLSGQKEDPTYFATSETYITEPHKTQDEFIVDFKYDFVKFAFEQFDFKVVDNFCITKDRRKRINFFMNNGFLASLIVLVGKGQPAKLPEAALKYVTGMDLPCKQGAQKVDEKLFAKAKQRDSLVQTNPLDFTAQRPKLTEDMVELFGQCVKVFDEKASIIKLKLVDYTPYIRLDAEHKLYVFREIMKFVYLQCIESISNNVDPFTKEYTPMDKDE